MICNAEEPMCIAGVFGGLDSGTTESTKDVFLESAYFHPTWVRKTARRHGLSTDSSFRFERGIDPNGVIYALKEAALLVKELAGGEIASEIKDNYPAPIADFAVELSYDYVNSLIGKVIPAETVKSIVSSLEMKIVEETAEGLSLLVPPYRVDVQRPCDVVEDILRIYGYNNVEIPTSVKSSLSVKGEVDKSVKLQNIVSEQLVGCGFNEILNNSLTAAAYYEGLETYKPENLVRLMNPLSNDLNVMRATLLFGGLESIQHNANRKNAENTFNELLSMGVIPIVNENDSISTYELQSLEKFGDNDTLSAVVAALIGADLLILMSDIDGLFTDDPNTNPEAEFIDTVEQLDDKLLNMGKGSTGSKVGTGGMATKLTAARIATAAGTDMVIANGGDFHNIHRIVEGDKCGTLFVGKKQEEFYLIDYIEKLL